MAESKGLSFKAWRILFLLGALLLVVLWGWNKERGLERRTDWDSPLRLNIVIVEEEPVDPLLITAMREEAAKAEAWFRAEMTRYREVLARPLIISVVGPTALPRKAPQLPMQAEFVDVVRFTWDLWRWRMDVDDQLGSMPDSDSRVYIIVRPGSTEEDAERFVEGLAEQGGEVGLVSIDLADDMIHLAMMTTLHEFLHTIGATDKYAADGTVIVPRGLGDPDAIPRFPQVAAEVMGRNVVEAEGQERLPNGWAELVVGPYTAAEIGWSAN